MWSFPHCTWNGEWICLLWWNQSWINSYALLLWLWFKRSTGTTNSNVWTKWTVEWKCSSLWMQWVYTIIIIILSMLEYTCLIFVMLRIYYYTDSEYCYLLYTCRSFFNGSCTSIDWYNWWHRSNLHWNCHNFCYHHHYSLQDESKTQQTTSGSAACAWQGYYRCWKQDLWRNWSNAPAKDGHRKQCCLCFVSQCHEISFMRLSATV